MKRFLIFILIASAGFGISIMAGAQPITPTDKKIRDGVYDKTAISQVPPIPYPYLREADIVWTKRIWRVVDLREKMNQPFYFPVEPQNEWKSFAQILWDAVLREEIVAYDAIDDQFTKSLPAKEVLARVEYNDSTLVTDTANEDQKMWRYDTTKFSSANVKKFLIKEDYYFDKQRSVFEVRILGICPVVPLMVKGVAMNTDKPLFWIYFPECRDLLAKNEMFNLKNGTAGRMSYDDVFMKRMFSSYVYKEENVYDRTILDYTAGVDALLESEKAKNLLHDFETNLWEY